MVMIFVEGEAGARVTQGFRGILSEDLVRRFERGRAELPEPPNRLSKACGLEGVCPLATFGHRLGNHRSSFFLGWVQVTALWWTKEDAT